MLRSIAKQTVLAGALLATTLTVAASTSSYLEDGPKNWGNWGSDDEVGALNYLTPEQILKGVGEVTSGKVFTLQIPMTHNFGPVFPGRIPMMHYMAQDEGSFKAGKKDALAGGVKFSDDVAFMYLQGTTHVDALAHAWTGEEVYGGTTANSTVNGHTHADVAAIGQRGVVGRGVLLDVGRTKGGEDTRLEPNECITLDDIIATAQAEGVTLKKRDILLIRTGSIARYFDKATNSEWDAMTEPGLCYSEELVAWFKNMEIPFIAADNLAIEKVVQEINNEQVVIPLHVALMRNLGVVLSEIYWLEDLAADSAVDKKYTFLFTAAPLKVEQGSGSPINPIVIK